MKSFVLATCLTGLAAAVELPLGVAPGPAAVSRIPTSYESAVMARRVLALTKLATLSTVFPDSHRKAAHDDGTVETQWGRPAGLEGHPIGLMDYVADCETAGNPSILKLNVGTSFQNVQRGSAISASFQWTPPYPPQRRMLTRLAAFISSLAGGSPYERILDSSTPPDTVPYSAANLPRFSLFGYLEPINPDPVEALRLATCFTSKHPDARYWLPGNVIHESSWARLVVTQVYWIGGFGDRAFIGWIPIEEWRNVTKDEWSQIKLPGEEKGWNEWALDSIGEL